MPRTKQEFWSRRSSFSPGQSGGSGGGSTRRIFSFMDSSCGKRGSVTQRPSESNCVYLGTVRSSPRRFWTLVVLKSVNSGTPPLTTGGLLSLFSRRVVVPPVAAAAAVGGACRRRRRGPPVDSPRAATTARAFLRTAACARRLFLWVFGFDRPRPPPPPAAAGFVVASAAAAPPTPRRARRPFVVAAATRRDFLRAAACARRLLLWVFGAPARADVDDCISIWLPFFF